MEDGSLKHFSPLMKLLLIAISGLTGMLMVSSIMILIAGPILALDLTNPEILESHVGFLRLMQSLQSIIVFILPAYFGFRFFYPKSESAFPGHGRFTLPFALLCLSLIVFCQPFISWSAWLNEQLVFAGPWSRLGEWITSTEDKAKEMTELMVQTSGPGQSLLTILILAVLPAIGEEMLFRGLLQRELSKSFNSVHLAIMATAVIFSAVHMQFLTFMPRFVLGIILGYLMLYSANIWVPITAHFLNNSIAVVLYGYYQNHNLIEQDATATSAQAYSPVLVVLSLLSTIILLVLAKKLKIARKT